MARELGQQPPSDGGSCDGAAQHSAQSPAAPLSMPRLPRPNRAATATSSHRTISKAAGAGPHNMGCPPKTMALITSDHGIMCSLRIKWP